MDEDVSTGERVGRVIGVIALVASPLLLWWMVRALVPSETPRFSNKGFIEAIFASRFVITAVRFAILAGSVFVFVSVVALIARGQWLTSAGPFRVADSVRAIEQERDRLAAELESAVDVIEQLDAELQDRTAELARVRDEFQP